MRGVFLVKLVARPDARMVEVPLEIEAELPREFDGAALLASSGLPRKVKIKAQKDALKLSTAYRADQLLADIVRTSLRGSPQDVARVQDAARTFMKTVRERRRDGATLLVQSNGRGRIDVSESAPQGQARPGAAQAASEATPAHGTLADRVGALERRLGQLESGFAKLIGEGGPGAHLTFEARLKLLEEQLGVERGQQEGRLSEAAEVAALPTPGAEPRGRTALRRGTAVEAFSEGLRAELRARATQLLGGADRAAMACDQAARLAAEAVRDLGAPPETPEGETLRKLSTEAGARQRALQRFAEEVDLYAPPELPIAERLLERLSQAVPTGELWPDPAQPLDAFGAGLVSAGNGTQLLASWMERAAPLCGWTLLEPKPGDPLQEALHEALPGGEPGAAIARVIVPGVRRRDGALLARARVLLEGSEAALAAEAQALLSDDAREGSPGAPAAAPAGDASGRAASLPAPEPGGEAASAAPASLAPEARAAEVASAVETKEGADAGWANVARGPAGLEESDDFAVSDADVEEVQELAADLRPGGAAPSAAAPSAAESNKSTAPAAAPAEPGTR